MKRGFRSRKLVISLLVCVVVILMPLIFLVFTTPAFLYDHPLSIAAVQTLERIVFESSENHWINVINSPPDSLTQCESAIALDDGSFQMPSFMFFKDTEKGVEPFYPLYLEDYILRGELFADNDYESRYQIRTGLALYQLYKSDMSLFLSTIARFKDECPTERDGIIYYSISFVSNYNLVSLIEGDERELWRRIQAAKNPIYRLLAVRYADKWAEDNSEFVDIACSALLEDYTVFHNTILPVLVRTERKWSDSEKQKLIAALEQFLNSPKVDRNDGGTMDAEGRQSPPRPWAERLMEKLSVK